MSRERIPGLTSDSERALLERFERLERRLAAVEKTAPPELGFITQNFSAVEWQVVIVAAPATGIKGLLPAPRAQNQGAPIVLVFTTAGPVTLSCSGGTVNGSATVVNQHIGSYLAVCDGVKGWQVSLLSFANSSQILYNAATNSFSFAAAPAKSALVNATNASAVPSYLAGSAGLQCLRVVSTNDALEWAMPASPLGSNGSTIVTQTNSTTTAVGVTAPVQASSLAAGSLLRAEGYLTIDRGATATASNLVVELTFGGTIYATVTVPIFTVAGHGFVQIIGYLLCLSSGAAGTFVANVAAIGNIAPLSATPTSAEVYTLLSGSTNAAASGTTKDTTVLRNCVLQAHMSVAVANLSLNWVTAAVTRLI